MAKQGRCIKRKIHYIFPRDIYLRVQRCPKCGGKLTRTNRLCKDTKVELPNNAITL